LARELNFTLFYFAAYFEQLAPNGLSPFLQDGGNVASLANDGHDRYEVSPQWFIDDVMLAHREQQQSCAARELMPLSKGCMVLSDVLRARMQILEVAICQGLAPPRARPCSRFV
jgi:hypothetical protein